MPFTKTPLQSTQQTKMVPLMYEYETRERSGAKDTDALNVIWEPVMNQVTGDNYFNALTRDGSLVFDTGGVSSFCVGLFFWNVGPGYLIVVNTARVNVLFADDLTLAATFAMVTAGTETVGGTEFLYQNGNRSFMIYNGSALLEIASAGLVFTLCVDPDLPVQVGPKVTDVEFLDGYLFIGQPNGTISNSDLNNPQSWTASNFIKADAYGDQLVALKRSGNYLVALGAASIQYYYDAGNPTGTPLGAMVGSTLSIGCVGAVTKKENALYFVGVSSAGMYRVYKLENFKPTDISTASIQRFLTTTTVIKNNNSSFIHGNMIMLNGHVIYVISQSPGTAINPLTYGLDLETMLWSRYQFNDQLMQAATGNRAANSTQENKIRTVYTVRNNTTQLYQFEPNTGTDAGGLFSTTFVTPQQDFGTYRNKFGGRLVLWADKPSISDPVFSVCNVSWTDDDYQTFSTPRPLQMFQARPALYALGSFNRRAFKVIYNGGLVMRWKMLELDYDQGDA